MNKLDSLHITCRYTGIQGQLDLPAVKGKTLEYTHPLANVDSCSQLFAAGSNYYRRLPSPILAGMIITTLKHYKLSRTKNHPAAINAMLCKAKRSSLLKLLDTLFTFVAPMVAIKQASIPCISLDDLPETETQCTAFVKQVAVDLLQNVTNISVSTKEERDTLTSDEYSLRLALQKIEADRLHKRAAIREEQKEAAKSATKAKATKFTLSDLEATADGESVVTAFIANHPADTNQEVLLRLYKLALKALSDSYAINAPQQKVLRSLASTLFTMEDGRRGQVLEKLKAINSKYSASLQTVIKLCASSSESTAISIEDELEVTAIAEAPAKKLSLLERLALVKGNK